MSYQVFETSSIDSAFLRWHARPVSIFLTKRYYIFAKALGKAVERW
jgi:hypothetical protein